MKLRQRPTVKPIKKDTSWAIVCSGPRNTWFTSRGTWSVKKEDRRFMYDIRIAFSTLDGCRYNNPKSRNDIRLIRVPPARPSGSVKKAVKAERLRIEAKLSEIQREYPLDSYSEHITNLRDELLALAYPR